MSMCRVSWAVRKGWLLEPACSFDKTVSFYSASFCTPRLNLPVTPTITWLPIFAFQSPMMKKAYFLVLVLEGLVGLHRISEFQLRGWGVNLNYCDVEWFALEMNWDHSVVFEIIPKHCILDSFVDYEGYSIFSKGFLPTVVDIIVICIEFSHSCSL